MQTPIQQAIEQIEAQIKNNDNNTSIEGWYKIGIKKGLKIALNELTALLPTERDVIEDAWDTGKQDGKDMGYHGRAEHTSANHYFTTKFNDNEKSNV